MRIEDAEFKSYLEEVTKLDWSGLDLTLFGGIVSDWETKDIDCRIMGEYDEERLAGLMLEMKRLGPWSPYYTNDSSIINDFETPRKILIAFPDSTSRTNTKLTWKWFKFPHTKWLIRKRKGILNGEPIMVIQNGTQIYL